MSFNLNIIKKYGSIYFYVINLSECTYPIAYLFVHLFSSFVQSMYRECPGACLSKECSLQVGRLSSTPINSVGGEGVVVVLRLRGCGLTNRVINIAVVPYPLVKDPGRDGG